MEPLLLLFIMDYFFSLFGEKVLIEDSFPGNNLWLRMKIIIPYFVIFISTIIISIIFVIKFSSYLSILSFCNIFVIIAMLLLIDKKNRKLVTTYYVP
jgi:hypothetical protein